MNTRAIITTLLALAGLALASPAHGGTMSSGPNAPTLAGFDIANYGTPTGSDKWYDSIARGQTFTIGSAPVVLKTLTYKLAPGSMKAAAPSTTYTVRVGTVSGTTFTQIASENFTQTVDTGVGDYVTWTFASPVALAANTTYAVDVAMFTTSDWHTGIPYPSYTGNQYAGGQFYYSGANGGDNNMTFTSGQDRIFYLRLQSALAPSPEPGATNDPSGPKTLSWSNLTPNTGTNVWVDVWFGTNPAALTKVVSTGLNITNVSVSAPVAATYYWRVDSYLNGAPTGTPVTGTLFNFVVTDTDGDGIPDWWMIQYFGHPTAQVGDLSRATDDPDNDGLNNLQEYQRGTNPLNRDTDGDGLSDGDEVNIYHTDPTKADTDGDGLSDGDEVNIYHTNPLNPDTDGDGLSDGDEVNIYHTNPLLADTDGDGVGDWYEVMAAFTDPNDPGRKPSVPYPLPKPDGSKGATNKPVKVFLLSGQSNMVGMGDVSGYDGAGARKPGTLEDIVIGHNKFPDLLGTNGNWAVRSNVWYKGVVTATAAGPLQPGCGAGSGNLGPELGFGRVMGYYYDEPVLLIKASQGNRGLFWDILPPGSPECTNGTTVYAGYGEAPNSWTVGGGPSPFVWYAGKQYDDFFLAESDMGAPVWANGTAYTSGCYVRDNGGVYTAKSAHTASADSEPGVGASWATYWSVYSIENVVDVLDNFATRYPQWAAQGFEIAGYVWFQGHWDSQNAYTASRYETNYCNLIKTVRHYYENRYPTHVKPNAPWVAACIGFDGWAMTNTPGDANYLTVANAQLAVGDPVKHPEFGGTVKTVESRSYWRPSGPSGEWYHYWHNAETYMLVGDAIGRGMMSMLGGVTSPVVDNGAGAANLAVGAAQLRGTLTNGPADVRLYWGPADGGTSPSSWANSILLTNTPTGSFAASVSNLLYGVGYYYRCYASNTNGAAWAMATARFTTLRPGLGCTLSNTAATSLASSSAALHATLGCAGAAYSVYALWNTVNGGTNAALWTNSAYVGSWTNLAGTNLSFSATGLAAGTTWYFTFVATNAAESLWAANVQSFTTLPPPPPVVDNSAGAANQVPGVVQLRGTLASGPADVRFYWGAMDGGTNPVAWASSALVTGAANGSVSVNGSNLLYGLRYYYRASASNQWGAAWSPATASFTTLKPVTATAVQIPYSNMVEVFASSQYGGNPATNAFNGSGLQGNGTHTASGNWFSSGAAAVSNEWLKVRFDQAYVLDHLRVWAFNAGSVTPGVTNADVYVLGSATDPAGNVNLGGGPFKTNGWSLQSARQRFTPGASAATETNTDASISLGGVTAQQLGLKINNVVSGTYAGFAEVQIYQLPSVLSLNNLAATGVGSASGTLNATLGCTGAVYGVTAYWNTVNGGTSAALWTNAAYVGSWTNLGSVNLSYAAMGLKPGTPYYFTFCATNVVDTLWAANVQSFTTLTSTAPPTPVLPVSGVAVTNGVPVFSFTAAGGCKYRLDYKNLLTDTAWSYGSWSTNTSGSPAPMTLIDLSATGKPQRFYRLEAGVP